MLPHSDPRPYIVQLLDNNPDFNFDCPTETLATVDTPAEALDLALADLDRQLLLRPFSRGTPAGLFEHFTQGGRSPVIAGSRPLPFSAEDYALRLCATIGGVDASEALDDAARMRAGDGWVMVFPGRDAPARTPRWIEGCRRMTGARGAQVVLHASWDRIAAHLGEHLPSLRAIGLERLAWLLCADKGTFTKPE